MKEIFTTRHLRTDYFNSKQISENMMALIVVYHASNNFYG